MSHSALAIAGLYDHEQETERRTPDWGGDEVFAGARSRRRFERGSHAPARIDPPRRRETTEHALPRAGAAAEARLAEPAPELVRVRRRTVTVTGHPGAADPAPRPRRPGRSIDERLAARPERIAAWAVGMGLLLILIAIVTAPS